MRIILPDQASQRTSFCSAAGLRSRHRPALQSVPRQAGQQHRQLHDREWHHAVLDRRPDETPGLQSFGDQNQSRVVKDQEFDPVRPARAEHEDIAGKRIGPDLVSFPGWRSWDVSVLRRLFSPAST
jgi:hypothetical protein